MKEPNISILIEAISQNNTEHLKGVVCSDPFFTLYLNPVSLTDIFLASNCESLLSTPLLQSILNNSTAPLVKRLYGKGILSTQSAMSTLYNSSTFSYNFSVIDFRITNLYTVNLSTMTRHIEVNKPATHVEYLIELFPAYKDPFELFEVISLNIDNSLYAHLSLPPVKLHYPEPFVASPSFVHEEF